MNYFIAFALCTFHLGRGVEWRAPRHGLSNDALHERITFHARAFVWRFSFTNSFLAPPKRISVLLGRVRAGLTPRREKRPRKVIGIGVNAIDPFGSSVTKQLYVIISLSLAVVWRHFVGSRYALAHGHCPMDDGATADTRSFRSNCSTKRIEFA